MSDAHKIKENSVTQIVRVSWLFSKEKELHSGELWTLQCHAALFYVFACMYACMWDVQCFASCIPSIGGS